MFKVQTLNNISEKGLELLPKNQFEVGEKTADPDGILVRSFKMNDLELPASLKAVARAGAGVNNIPVDRCSQKGIVVFNTPGANANSVKELLNKHLKSPPPPLEAANRRVTPEFAQLVRWAMAKSPAERPRSSDDFCQRVSKTPVFRRTWE